MERFLIALLCSDDAFLQGIVILGEESMHSTILFLSPPLHTRRER